MKQRGMTHWSSAMAVTGFWVALISIIMAICGAYAAGFDLWSKISAVSLLRLVFFFVIIAAILNILALLVWGRLLDRKKRILAVIGLVLSSFYIAFIGGLIWQARSVPAIHDISTDIESPPHFVTIKLRKDNWSDIPGRNQSKFRGLSARERWQKIHAEHYGDLKTLRVMHPVAKVMDTAEALALERGWTIAAKDVAHGRLEASATVSPIAFVDDVVIRVQPGDDGQSAIVDMRSVSRLGKGDLGVNAQRIRAFMKDLEDRLK